MPCRPGKTVGKHSKSPDPRREVAFLLFANGVSIKDIAARIAVKPATLTGWRVADDWNSRLEEYRKKYREEMLSRMVGERAQSDVKAMSDLLKVRNKLIEALAVSVDGMTPDKIAGSLKAVQEVMAKIDQPAKADEDAAVETTGFDFIAEPSDG